MALALGFVRLDDKSIWVDESFTLDLMKWSPVDLLDSNYLLNVLALKTWAAVVGDGTWELRASSVVAAAAAAALVYALGLRLLGRRGALASGLLAAVSPFLVAWSQQVRGYTVLLALVTATALALTSALQRPGRGRWTLYGLLLAVSIAWHPYAALVVPAHLAAVAWYRPRPGFRPILVAVVGAFAVTAPWLAVVAGRENTGGGPTTWLEQPGIEAVVIGLVIVAGPPLVGLVLAGLGAVALSRSDTRWVAMFLCTWAAAPFVITIGLSFVEPLFLDRYLIVASPAFALLGGAALGAVRWRPAFVAALTAVVVVCALSLSSWYRSDGGENWRGAVAYLGETRTNGEAVLVAPFWARPSFAYAAGALELSAQPSGSPVWVLVRESDTDERVTLARSELGLDGYALSDERSFGRSLWVQRWERR